MRLLQRIRVMLLKLLVGKTPFIANMEMLYKEHIVINDSIIINSEINLLGADIQNNYFKISKNGIAIKLLSYDSEVKLKIEEILK